MKSLFLHGYGLSIKVKNYGQLQARNVEVRSKTMLNVKPAKDEIQKAKAS